VELSSTTVPQQLHQNSSKSVLEKGDRYAFSSLLYHAVLKSPNFHRAVGPKEGVGVSGLGANAFSRRLAATPLCSRPHLHLAVLLSSAAPLLASPGSSLLSDSPRSSLLTAIQTFPPSEGPGPTNASHNAGKFYSPLWATVAFSFPLHNPPSRSTIRNITTTVYPTAILSQQLSPSTILQ
jgi:hypothetical protein